MSTTQEFLPLLRGGPALGSGLLAKYDIQELTHKALYLGLACLVFWGTYVGIYRCMASLEPSTSWQGLVLY